MGRYSCAIGPCDEKSYKKSDGVQFFRLIFAPPNMKNVWKTKIMDTRKDIKSMDDIKNVCIVPSLVAMLSSG